MKERLKKALFAPFLDDYYLLLPNDSNFALVPNKRFLNTYYIIYNKKYHMRAIITRSQFEAALVYKRLILSFKKVSCNTSRYVAAFYFF